VSAARREPPGHTTQAILCTVALLVFASFQAGKYICASNGAFKAMAILVDDVGQFVGWKSCEERTATSKSWKNG
jgi:hypothetical protein